MKRNILLLLLFLISIVSNAQENSDPNIDEIYFTSRSGERITGTVSVAEKVVYLNIVTTNAKGEKVLITMDEDEEYFYKKKFLGAGSFIKIPIKKDLQKVKLVIYNVRNKKHVKRRMEQGAIDAAEAEDAKDAIR